MLFTKQYETRAAAIGTACHGHVKWPATPPRATTVNDAASIAIMTLPALTNSLRNGRAPSGSARHRVMMPAAATNSAALPPRSSSAVKSTTKDGVIIPRSSAVDRGIAKADVRIAARITAQNSRVRSGCGQPIDPSRTAAPIRIAATTSRRKNLGNVIQESSAWPWTDRFTTAEEQCQDQLRGSP